MDYVIFTTQIRKLHFLFSCVFFFFLFLLFFVYFFLIGNDSRGQNYHNSLQVSGKFIEKMKSVYAETGKRPKINIRKDCYLKQTFREVVGRYATLWILEILWRVRSWPRNNPLTGFKYDFRFHKQ